MSLSDQKDLKLDDYPGGFSSVDRSRYDFPAIWYVSRLGQKTTVEIYVQGCWGAVDQGIQAEIDGSWKAYDVDVRYWYDNPEDAFYCRIKTNITVKNLRESPATVVAKGKNTNRSNATTIFHQAIMDAYSLYKDYALTPYKFVEESPHLHDGKRNEVAAWSRMISGRIPPMLACSQDPKTWFESRLHVVVQPKYNGVRLMAGRRKDDQGRSVLMMYSRGLRDMPVNNCTIELNSLTERWPELLFDGELYKEGASLSQISGTSRNMGKGKAATPVVCDFKIYDVYVAYAPEMPYGERHLMYQKIGVEVKGQYQYLKFIQGMLVSEWAAVEKYYRDVVNKGYEGLMLKDATAAYEASYGDYRGSSMCKMKERLSAEFRCVGWSVGEGKFAKCVATWTMKIVEGSKTGVASADEKLKLGWGKTFACSLSAKDVQKKAWYAEFVGDAGAFKRQYYGQLATIEFFEVSDFGIPTQGSWIAFRDYEEVVGADDGEAVLFED